MHPEANAWRGGLQVFDIDLDALDGRSTLNGLDLLDDEERRRAARMATPVLRQRFVAAHAATRLVLAEALGVDAASLGFATGCHGKPLLATPRLQGFHFNLSHCQGRALLAIADCEVGVDVEGWIGRDTGRLAVDVLSAAELARFLECPPPDQPRELARHWSAKEALLKACGLGLQLDPLSVPVDTRGGWHRLPPPAGSSPWWLQRIELDGPFCAFVASERRIDAALVAYP